MSKLIYAILLVKHNDSKLFDTVSSLKGYADSTLHIIQLNKLAAIVCNITADVLTKDLPNVLAYASIIESLLINYTLLPMRFGSIIESNNQVFTMLIKNASNFENKLLRLENKSEFGIKINFESDRLKTAMELKASLQGIELESHTIKAASSIFRQYVEKKLVIHRVEEQYSTFKEQILVKIGEHLVQLNASFLFDKHGASSKLIDTYVLMEIDKKEALINLVNLLQLEFTSINFTLTGPWPPYNFVDNTLK